MAKPNIPNQKKAYNDLRLRIDKYTLLIEDIYNAYNLEASKIALSTPFSEGVFRFSDFPLTKDKVEKMLEMWRKDMTGAIKATTSQEWKKSNEFQDLLADGAMKYYYGAANGKRKRKYYQTNSDAYQAFIERKDKGMNLSKKIWVQSQDYKEELEAAISTGIQKGMSAVTLSKKVSKYLIDYPLLQKEYKEKFGKATTAKNCEYRSIRLARSEINIAYREAEQKRWSQFDFVVGKEIKISKVHFHRMPMGDLCDELQGKYPKDFPWNGWHPNCFCYEIPILKDEDEFFELEENEAGKNAVKDVPNVFVDWVDRNKDRILRAEERNTLPYFIRDNYNTVKGIITPKIASDILKKAELRHAARTKEQIQEIQDRWDERKKWNDNNLDIEKELGIKRGKPMSFEEANELRGNRLYVPKYKIEDGRRKLNEVYSIQNEQYHVNCQSCVVANELRRRGFDVTAFGNTKGSIPEKLSHHTELIWLDKDGNIPKSLLAGGRYIDANTYRIKTKTHKKMMDEFAVLTSEPGRYHLKWGWKKSRDGHIITAERKHDGSLIIYDPQNGEKIKKFVQYSKYISPAGGIRVLRVDNLSVNTEIINKVVYNVDKRIKDFFAASTKSFTNGNMKDVYVSRKAALNSDRFILDVISKPNLFTKKINRSKKSLARTLNHCNDVSEIDALAYIWENIDKMSYVRYSVLGEGKDLTTKKAIKNIENKKKRGVVGYHVYKFKFKNKEMFIKTEEHRGGFEQFYSFTLN